MELYSSLVLGSGVPVQDRWEAVNLERQFRGAAVGIPPLCCWASNQRPLSAGGQCQAGSLTGAVASERVSEALKGSLRMVGNHSKSAKAEGSLTATPTGGAGTKVGLSDPVV